MLKQRLMTPGPTPVPEETLLELAKPVTFHRSGQFRAILFAHKRRAHRLICGQLLALCISRAFAL